MYLPLFALHRQDVYCLDFYWQWVECDKVRQDVFGLDFYWQWVESDKEIYIISPTFAELELLCTEIQLVMVLTVSHSHTLIPL
jgi:hypothetical protein